MELIHTRESDLLWGMCVSAVVLSLDRSPEASLNCFVYPLEEYCSQ